MSLRFEVGVGAEMKVSPTFCFVAVTCVKK